LPRYAAVDAAAALRRFDFLTIFCHAFSCRLISFDTPCCRFFTLMPLFDAFVTRHDASISLLPLRFFAVTLRLHARRRHAIC